MNDVKQAFERHTTGPFVLVVGNLASVGAWAASVARLKLMTSGGLYFWKFAETNESAITIKDRAVAISMARDLMKNRVGLLERPVNTHVFNLAKIGNPYELVICDCVLGHNTNSRQYPAAQFINKAFKAVPPADPALSGNPPQFPVSAQTAAAYGAASVLTIAHAGPSGAAPTNTTSSGGLILEDFGVMFITNINLSITELNVGELFSQAGKVVHVQLNKNAGPTENNGSATVWFERKKSVDVAFNMFHNKSVNPTGRQINIYPNYAGPNTPTTFT